MKQLLITACLLLIGFTSFAQTQFGLEGPREFCVFECADFFPFGSANGDPLNFNAAEINVVVTNLDSTEYDVFTNTQGEFQLCIYVSGDHNVIAQYELPNFPDEILIDSFEVFVYDQGFVDIFEENPNNCREVNGCFTACKGSTIRYYAESPTGNQGEWIVDGATNVSYFGDYVEVEWGEAGFGNVTYLGFDFGCTSEQTRCVVVLDDAEAEFEVEESSLCRGQQIEFINTSTNAVNFFWDLGNGQTSTEIIPVASYEDPGTYTVSLIASNACMCETDTFSLDIEVSDLFYPKLSCVGTVCPGDTVTYTSEDDCSDITWTATGDNTVIDGGSNSDDFIQVVWNNGPLGEVTLSPASCEGEVCVREATFDVPVISDNTPIEGERNVCRNSIEVYHVQKYGSTDYNWRAVGGTIMSGQGSNAVTVMWTNTNGTGLEVSYSSCYFKCGGASTTNINVTDQLLVEGISNACAGEPITFNAKNASNDNPTSVTWIVYDDDTVVDSQIGSEYTNSSLAAGKYTLLAQSATLCNGTRTIEFSIDPPSPALSGIDGLFDICPNLPYTYSVAPSSSKSEIFWTITNGANTNNINGSSITVEWGASGPYEISVYQIDNEVGQCPSDTIVQVVAPINAFTLDHDPEACIYAETVIRAEEVEGQIYNWSFVPEFAGTIIGNSQGSEITVMWNTATTVEIILNVCDVETRSNILVNPLPTFAINSPTSLCEGSTEVITLSNAYTSYNWSNDEQQIVSNSDSPALGGGSYIVEVTDDKGCVNEEAFTIKELPSPNIRLSTPDNEVLCAANGDLWPQLYGLNAEDGYTFSWYKDGVLLPSIADSIYRINDYGNYQIEVEDNNGCTNRSNGLIVQDNCVSPPTDTIDPMGCTPASFASFDVSPGQYCNEFDFASTTIDAGSVYWNFQDYSSSENFSQDKNVTHRFTNAGFYKVTMTTNVESTSTGTDSCRVGVRRTIEVPLAADFELINGCPGVALEFVDRSTFIPDLEILTWSWDFGDPTSSDNTSSLADPQHTYSASGDYVVTLEISGSGCTSIIQKVITIRPRPEANIVVDNVICEGESTGFSVDNPNNLLNFVWDFGDPRSADANTSDINAPFHIFETTDSYKVDVNIENIYGCTNTLTTDVGIVPNTLDNTILPSVGTSLCPLDTNTLTLLSGTEYEWSTGETASSIEVAQAGVYTATITDDDGCMAITDPYIQDVEDIVPVGIRRVITVDGVPSFTFGDIVMCEGEDLVLEAITPSSTYTWSNGVANEPLTFTSDNGNLLSAGTYTYSLVVMSNGCQFRSEVNVLVSGLPSIAVSGPNGTLCLGIEHTFSIDNPDLDLTYTWSNGKTGTSISVSTAGNYYAIATNENGCESVSNAFIVQEGPDVDLVPTGCYTRCDTDTICLPNVPNVTTYQWKLNGVDIPASEGGDMKELITSTDGDYQLHMIDNLGCEATSGILALQFRDGIGDLTFDIGLDADKDGVSDSPISNVIVKLLNAAGDTIMTQSTDANGTTVFANILTEEYTVFIDTSSVEGVYGNVPFEYSVVLEGCDDMEALQVLINGDCLRVDIEENLIVCEGTIFTPTGLVVTKDTIIEMLVETPGRCDTLYTYNITNSPIDFAINQTAACFGENDGTITFINPNNHTITWDGTPVVGNEVTNLASSNYNLVVENTDGCVENEVVFINENEEISYTASTEASCFGENNGEITLNLGNANSYLVNGQVNQGANNPNLTPGNYQLTVVGDDGCEVTELLTVDEADEIVYSYMVEEPCFGTDEGVLTLSSSNNVVYLIDGIQQGSNIIDGLSEGSYELTVVDGDCEVVEMLTIDAVPELQYSYDLANPCPDQDNGAITITMPVDYIYAVNGVTQPSNVTTGLAAGTHDLVVSSNGCEDQSTFELVELESFNFEYSIEEPCSNSFNGKIIIEADGAKQYFYNDKEFANNEITGVSEGQAEVIVISENGCVATEDIEVQAQPDIEYVVEASPYDCDLGEAEVKLDVTSHDAEEYQVLWSTGEVSNEIDVLKPGIVSFKISTDCQEVADAVEVEDLIATNHIIAPNIFSPNGDNQNDEWSIHFVNPSIISDVFLRIVDKNGKVLFVHEGGTDFSWDGTAFGNELEIGVYVYELQAKINACTESGQINYVGDITIFK